MKRIRMWLRKLIALNGTPRGIAGGFTLGLGLSLIPIPFLGMVAALSLAPVVRANPVATYLGTLIVNPITGPLVFFFELWVGMWVLQRPLPSWEIFKGLSASGWWDMFLELLGPFLLGVAIVAVAATTLGYALVYLLTHQFQKKLGNFAKEQVKPPETARLFKSLPDDESSQQL